MFLTSHCFLFTDDKAAGCLASAVPDCAHLWCFRIVRAFLIEEQKIVKKVVKLQQQQKAGQA